MVIYYDIVKGNQKFNERDPDCDEKFNFLDREFNLLQALHNKYYPEFYKMNVNAVLRKQNGRDQNVCYILREHVQGVSLLDFFNTRVLDKYCEPSYEGASLAVPIKSELSLKQPFRIQSNLPTAIIL